MSVCRSLVIFILIYLLFSLPAGAERHRSNPLLVFEQTEAAKIHAHLKLPKLDAADLKRVRALALFLLQADGRITRARAVRESGELKAIGPKYDSDFQAIEKALIEAIEASSPLDKPPASLGLSGVSHEFLYVFEPSKNKTGTLTLLPFPTVSKKQAYRSK